MGLDLLLASTPPADSGGFDLLGIVLWPLKWAVELILVAWHWLFTVVGLPAASGVTWVLSIVGLVIVVRAAVFPLLLVSAMITRPPRP